MCKGNEFSSKSHLKTFLWQVVLGGKKVKQCFLYGRATGMDQYCFIVSQFVDVFIVSWPILDWKFFGSGIICSVLVWWLLGVTKQHRQLPLIMCRNGNFSMFSWKKLSTSANIILLIWEKRKAGFAASLFAVFSKGKNVKVILLLFSAILPQGSNPWCADTVD